MQMTIIWAVWTSWKTLLDKLSKLQAKGSDWFFIQYAFLFFNNYIDEDWVDVYHLATVRLHSSICSTKTPRSLWITPVIQSDSRHCKQISEVPENNEHTLIESQNGLVGRDLKAHPVPPPAQGQGHLPLSRGAPGPVRPGFGHFQAWGRHSSSGKFQVDQSHFLHQNFVTGIDQCKLLLKNWKNSAAVFLLYPTENNFIFQGIGQNPKTILVPKWFYMDCLILSQQRKKSWDLN